MDFVAVLREMFPNHSRQSVDEVINYVNDGEGLYDPDDFKLERMTCLLIDKPEDLLDEAVGYQTDSTHAPLLRQLIVTFPDACPKYLERILQTDELDYDLWVVNLQTNGYLKNEDIPNTLDEIHARLMEMLPKVDPSFLKTEAQKLIGQSKESFLEYVNNMLDAKDFPSIEEFHKRESWMKDIEKYTTNFSLDEFLRELPDPFEYFLNSERQHSLFPKSVPDDMYNDQVQFAQQVLYNKYNQLCKKDIDNYMTHYGNDVVQASIKLDKFPKALIKPREQQHPVSSVFNNKLLLQELAFVQFRHHIKQYLKLKDEAYRLSYEEAKRANLLETCQICFQEGLIPEECYFCRGDCVFCRECLKKGAEVIIGDGNLDFPCFNNCGKDISLASLQMVLDPIVFYRLDQRKQIYDIKRAKLEGFLTCQFCDYGNLQNPQDKIFVCKNNECGKETCLECGHESHVPLRCNEIEYAEDVKLRTFIENKMTEALLRTCQSCDKKIIKEHGCNKMTCVCGTTMCYVCGSSRIDYSHFQLGRCVLHSDQRELHRRNVLDGALMAKRELGVDINPSILKFDPTVDVDAYIP